KHRVNAFFGTDLAMMLRAHDIDTLVLLGHATSGVILSTVRYAADADYRLVVVEDGCADRDTAVHTFLMQHLFPRQATVVSAEAGVYVAPGDGGRVGHALRRAPGLPRLPGDGHASRHRPGLRLRARATPPRYGDGRPARRQTRLLRMAPGRQPG